MEAAQHLSNLLPDEEYPALAQTLTNAHTPEAVLDVLMTDVRDFQAQCAMNGTVS